MKNSTWSSNFLARCRKAAMLLAAAIACAGTESKTFAGESGDVVVVVYNSMLPDSKKVADHYVKRRNVPEEQVLGLELPTTETISREDFQALLQKPMFRFLEDKKLFSVRAETVEGTNGSPSRMFWRVKDAKVRYAVLCYGVPSRILEDSIDEPGKESLPPQLQRNGAAVDSELALLPMNDYKLPLHGFVQNPFLAATNHLALGPVNGILLVGRLDGPTAAAAQGLVDKAIEAEDSGLWGRAYFDWRGLKDGEYKLGDQLLKTAANITRKLGWETVTDEEPETFSAGTPLSHIAFYAGWYDEHVSGPFASSTAEFMPGAFAYHLHSFSAATIRSASKHWVGPLIAKGAAATIGYVDEPFLGGTIDVGVFADRFLRGFSFGEAAYASINGLSWQSTVIGDPLYRPVQLGPQQQHERLQMRNSPLLQWSHLKVANLNIVNNFPLNETIEYLEKEGKESAVLMEKLGDLHLGEGKTWQAINAYAQALNLKPSPAQEIRLLLALADKFAAEKRNEEAASMLKLLAKKFPDYPDIAAVNKRIATLAK